MGTPKKRRIKRRILLEKRNQTEVINEANNVEPTVLLTINEPQEITKNNNEEVKNIPNGLTVLAPTERTNTPEVANTTTKTNVTKKRKPRAKRNTSTKTTTSNTRTPKRRKATKKVASNT